MPITLPTSVSSNPTGTPTTTSTNNPPSSTTQTTEFLTSLKSRLFRSPQWSSSAPTRARCGTAVILLRAVSNFVHFVLYGFSRNPLWALWPVVDQLVVAYAVSFVVDASGGRRVFGVGVTERFFDIFLGACAVVHAGYMVVLLLCIISYAIFFGVTLGFIPTVVGALILPVAWLASRPEDEEGGLTLP